jgi:RND family efflux transporter MFP subunit
VVKEGQTLIRLDARDYEATVKLRESELARAELNLKLEQGNQRVAREEYQMLEDIVEDQDQELVLRQPHLEQARAALEAAKAALATAQLNVERCTVKAPFNAVVQEKLVDVGAQVSQSSRLLNLMGTDENWVQAKIPVDQLRWITIPDGDGQQGSEVKVFDEAAWGTGVWRQGSVLRLLGQLEDQGRLSQVLISVKDPLVLDNDETGSLPLLVNSYVRVQIEGKTLEGVMPVKREYLHDGDNIWIMNKEDRMEIRPVEVVFRDKETVYLSGGLENGERIVTTDISAPVEGMLLRLNSPVADMQPKEGQE